MPAKPSAIFQLQDKTAPLACRNKNCAVCCLAMETDRASGGRFKLTPTQIRNKAGVSCYSGTGGVGYLAGATAVKSLTGGAVILTVTNGTPTELRDDIVAGHAAVVSLDYSTLLGRSCACDDDFGGGHAVYVNGARYANGTWQYQYHDPLCDGRRDYPRGYQWVAASIIHKAALDRSGGNGINYVVCRDTEDVWRVARSNYDVHSKPSLTSTKLGELRKGRSTHVRRTVNGSEWAEARTIWHEITWGSRIGYVIGKALA